MEQDYSKIVELLRHSQYSYWRSDYNSCITIFEEAYALSLVVGFTPANHYLESYYGSLIKSKYPNVELNENHEVYKKLLLEYNNAIGRGTGEELTTTQQYTLSLLERTNTHFWFGQYKGELFKDIINIDPGYVIWCICRMWSFYLSEEDLLQISLRQNEDYLLALEYNTIKKLFIKTIGPSHNAPMYFDDDEPIDNSDKNYFYAMTDGMLGSWDDFEGNSDDIDTWSGL